jgi:hypothetical protein
MTSAPRGHLIARIFMPEDVADAVLDKIQE